MTSDIAIMAAVVQILENQIVIMKAQQWLVQDPVQLEELKDAVSITSAMIDGEEAR